MAMMTDTTPTHAAPSESRQIDLSARGRLGKLLGVEILATGAATPAQTVTNEQLATLGYDADWIVQRTGIRERRHAPAGMATSDLCLTAARDCLKRAEVSPAEVDLVLVATITPDYLTPSTACLVQNRLGVTAPAFDLNAACAGFSYALVTGMQFIATGNCRRVLVIGADLMSRVLDPADKKTFPLFGDGAGAVLLGPGRKDQGFLSYLLGADGAGADLLSIPGGGSREPLTARGLTEGRQFLCMDGRPVFKWAVRTMAESMNAVCDASALTPREIDVWIFHQANRRILDAAAESLRIDPARMVMNLDRYGNTSAGSVPLALHEATVAGRVRPGHLVGLLGFGAGLAWGGGILRV